MIQSMMSSLADMEIFARVVATGSMSAAARRSWSFTGRRFQAPGAAGRRAWNKPLQCTTRQIALDGGRSGAIMSGCWAILANIEEAEAFVARRSADARGTLKISAPTTFGRMHIAPYLVPLHARQCRSHGQYAIER